MIYGRYGNLAEPIAPPLIEALAVLGSIFIRKMRGHLNLKLLFEVSVYLNFQLLISLLVLPSISFFVF